MLASSLVLMRLSIGKYEYMMQATSVEEGDLVRLYMYFYGHIYVRINLIEWRDFSEA